MNLPQCNIDGAVTSSKVVNNNTRDNYNPIVPAKIVVSLSLSLIERGREIRDLNIIWRLIAGLFAIFCGKEKYLKYPFHKWLNWNILHIKEGILLPNYTCLTSIHTNINRSNKYFNSYWRIRLIERGNVNEKLEHLQKNI